MPVVVGLSSSLYALTWYLFAITPPRNSIKADGIEVTAWSMKEALRIFEMATEAKDKDKA